MKVFTLNAVYSTLPSRWYVPTVVFYQFGAANHSEQKDRKEGMTAFAEKKEPSFTDE